MIRTAEFHLKTAMMACPNKTGRRGIDELMLYRFPSFLFYKEKRKDEMNYEKLFEKSGLAAVILLSIVAATFLPRSIAQWVIIGEIIVFGIVKGVEYWLSHKDEFFRKRRITAARKNNSETDNAFKYAVIQLSHRITDKLHSAFPESSWSWLEKPTAVLFADGGRVRISTSKTESYNEADVMLDAYGRIDIKMLETKSFSEIVKDTDEKADTDYTVDAKAWYEQWGQKVLTDIITELNAKGTRVLCINEDGTVVIDDDKKVGTLKSFPTKNLWKKLVSVFEESGLTAVENENSIQIGW